VEKHLLAEIAQKAIITNSQNQVLLTKDLNDPLWELPGGRLNVDESPEEGLEREILEEVGLEIKVIAPFLTGLRKNFEGNIRFMVVYLCELINPDQKIHLQENEIGEYKWVGKKDWKDLSIFPEFEQVLEKYLS
jgi:8-oxo-dGTP diphosphatase